MLSNDERSRLADYRVMATMNQTQALDYHELLNKEYYTDMTPITFTTTSNPGITFTTGSTTYGVEPPKKRGRKKK